MTNRGAAHNSIGVCLTDTLDDMIGENRLDPQLAMKVVANFDRAMSEVLSDKVKARLTFKVSAWSRFTVLLAAGKAR